MTQFRPPPGMAPVERCRPISIPESASPLHNLDSGLPPVVVTLEAILSTLPLVGLLGLRGLFIIWKHDRFTLDVF